MAYGPVASHIKRYEKTSGKRTGGLLKSTDTINDDGPVVCFYKTLLFPGAPLFSFACHCHPFCLGILLTTVQGDAVGVVLLMGYVYLRNMDDGLCH